MLMMISSVFIDIVCACNCECGINRERERWRHLLNLQTCFCCDSRRREILNFNVCLSVNDDDLSIKYFDNIMLTKSLFKYLDETFFLYLPFRYYIRADLAKC